MKRTLPRGLVQLAAIRKLCTLQEIDETATPSSPSAFPRLFRAPRPSPRTWHGGQHRAWEPMASKGFHMTGTQVSCVWGAIGLCGGSDADADCRLRLGSVHKATASDVSSWSQISAQLESPHVGHAQFASANSLIISPGT